MSKKAFTVYIILFIIIIFAFSFSSFLYLKKEEQNLLNNKYILLSKQINKNIDFLIEDKKMATLSLALATSKFEKIKNALSTNNTNNLDLSKFSKELNKKTNFKNIWFQLIDTKGNSIYRSWNEKKNDSLLFRNDVKKLIKNPKILNTISIGRFDMTFTAMIPIYHLNNFIGILEVITHFNSISKTLENEDNNSIIFANKSHFKTITHPFTNNFIDKYYVSNLNAKDYLIKTIKKFGIEKLLRRNSYTIFHNQFIINYKIKDFQKNVIGHIIVFRNLNNIDLSDIKNFKTNFIFNIIFTLILLAIGLSFIFYYIFSQKIILEKKKAQQILDSQENIIILTDGENLNNANKQFLNFFNQYNSLDEFKLEHRCICEMFIDLNDENYLIEKDYGGKNWAQFILENKKRSFKAAMEKNGKLEHFVLNVSLTLFSEENAPYIVVTLTNISADIKQKSELKLLNNNLEHLVEEKTKELKELNESLEVRIEKEILKNKKKDEILFQHNKLLAMGEMINNIAHQWRQPLSAISTSASSLLLKKELNSLDNKSLEFLCSHIIDSSKFLSKTIEDFRIFYKQDNDEEKFLLKNIINELNKLLTNRLFENNIKLIHKIDETIEINCSKNQFFQVLLNLIDNSIEALIDNTKNERLIIISNLNNTLSIKDNANGIKTDIMEHIFEPYFTTKHKSQGKGIGLYMVKTILEKNMNYKIEVNNATFTYKNKEYFGANFIINFNS